MVFKNLDFFSALDISRPHQMVDIQYNTALWAAVKYHVPTGIGFSPKASGLYPFGDATDLAGEGGVGDVVWLIQAPA